jgi:hypothetical protein
MKPLAGKEIAKGVAILAEPAVPGNSAYRAMVSVTEGSIVAP